MRRPSLAFFFVALPFALLLLFSVQFMLCASSVFPASGWLAQPEHLGEARTGVAFDVKSLFLGALASAVASLVVMRLLRPLTSPSLLRGARPLWRSSAGHSKRSFWAIEGIL